MIEYKIVSVATYTSLEESVNKMAALGWIPQGGVCVSFINNRMIVSQAIVREFK